MFDLAYYAYSPHAVPTFVITAAVLALGLLVLIRERYSRVSLLFFLLAFLISIWLFCFSWMYSTTDETVALQWARLAYLGIPLIPTAVYHFSLVVLQRYTQRLTLIWLCWILSVCFATLIVSGDALVNQVEHHWWGYYPSYGWLAAPYLSFFLGVAVLVFREYWLAYKQAESELERRRIKSFFIAFSCLFLASLDYLTKFGVNFYPIGYVPTYAFLVIIARGILRYHLVDLSPAFAAGQIIETMQGAVLVADAEENIRVVNRAACALLGYQEGELVGRPVQIIGWPVGVGTATLPMLLRDGAWRDCKKIWRLKDGARVAVNLSASVLFDRDLLPVGSVYVALDITESDRAEAALRASEMRLRSLMQSAHDAIVSADSTGAIISWNHGAETIFGYSEAEALGQPLTLIMPQRYRDGHNKGMKRYLLTRKSQVIGRPIELHGLHKNGGEFPLELSLASWNAGDRVFFSGILRDITERRRAEQARLSEERYALAIQGAQDGLWDWSLESGEIYFSSRWKTMLGYSDEDIGNRPEAWFQRVHPEQMEQVKAEIADHLAGHTAHFESEHRMLHKDGSYRWMLSRGIAVRDAAGQASRIAGSQTDITERKTLVEQLARQALYDSVTQLPNRVLFVDLLRRSIARAKRNPGHLFAVLFLDIDRFKVVNDSLGHMVGDQLITGIARRLELCVRAEDTVARFGGDEFVILLDGIQDIGDSMIVAQRIQSQVMQPFSVEGKELVTTVSIGIALSATGYDGPEEILRDADTAMYRAKAHGKARHEVFDPVMHTRALGLLEMETDLRRAIEHQELSVHYQPIVSLANGEITGVEALTRWRHPQRGAISPAEFIPLAEETGLIQSLGIWLLRTVCVQYMAWKTVGCAPARIAINCSARQFEDNNLVELISSVLDETGMSAHALEIEITESIAMKNTDFSIAMLSRLAAMGITISIDDFGTGYSSLAYLKRFAIHTVKIDQSFLKNITQEADNAAIIRAIIALAHSLKLRVIAEGVETDEQLAFLQAQHCDEAQGYLLSRPIAAAEFTQLLHEHRATSEKKAS